MSARGKEFGLAELLVFSYTSEARSGVASILSQRKDSLMSNRRRTILLANVLAFATLFGSVGCHHPAYPQPYGAAPSPYASPWTTPGAAGMAPNTTLPPPPGYQAPTATVPQLPPPQGAGAASVPGASPPTGVQGPNWDSPGTLSQQQQRATVFDPFANNEVGPEIVGGRPRDFQKPMNEATRAHGFRDTRLPF
jgi:hypothetical protein